MPDFEREERYIVVKRKRLTQHQENTIRMLLCDLEVETEECVVVEADWPIYELVWETVENMAGPMYEGRTIEQWAWAAKGFAEKSDRLEADISRLWEFIKNAPVGTGVCCCGDDMGKHPDSMSCGHTPVDEWDWNVYCLEQELTHVNGGDKP